MAQSSEPDLARRYDAAAPVWADKMRLLGYYDAYLGFLSHLPRTGTPARVIDIGAGTAAMAEAWVAVHGAPERLTLLDPSRAMLDRGAERLRARGVEPDLLAQGLGPHAAPPHDAALAAHVIEHLPDPGEGLARMAEVLRPGGRLWLVASKPHWCNAIIWVQWRHRTFRDDEITRLLDRAGFDLEAVYAFPAGPPSRTSRGFVARKRG